MAYITHADEGGEMDPKLADLYKLCRDPSHGGVDNILRIHSHNPSSLEGHLSLYRTLMFGRSELSRARREMIGVVVSRANDCHY